MPEITGIVLDLIKTTMEKAYIPGISIAYRDGKTNITSTTTVGTTVSLDPSNMSDVQDDTVFGAASLSKPVFAYLVLKLIEKGVLSKIGESAASGLDRPLHELVPLDKFFHEHNKGLSEIDIQSAKAITPRMLLSHTSGLGMNADAVLSFTPGTEYAYSGMGLMYLQRVIEEQTGKSLGILAHEYVFSKSALDMEHSSFFPPGASKANAANSLHTTASDYAKLMTAWMQDPSPIMQQAFVNQISLTQDNQKLSKKDKKPAADHVDIKVKERLAWGLGLGLELDEHGKAVRAFHTGDMNQFRAQMALNLEDKTCITYFSNAYNDLDANGHVLGPLIITPKVPIDYAHTWFYSKFPFAYNVEQIPEQPNCGLRIQSQDKKEDSNAVMAAFMPQFAIKPVLSPHKTNEVIDAKSSIPSVKRQGGSYNVMGRLGLMPTQTTIPTPSPHEIREQTNEKTSSTPVIKKENLEETDSPSILSPIKIIPTPK